MKKINLLLFIAILLIFPYSSQASLANELKGKILLQVEKNGEAWYVIPDGLYNGRRLYLKDGDAAYNTMKWFSTGISNADLKKIPIGLEERFECLDSDADGLCNKLEDSLGTNPNNSDSDNDSYDDGDEIKNSYNPLGTDKEVYDLSLSHRLKGKIMLQVEHNGEAWYINPDDGKRYYMPDGPSAYQIMRYLSLGISNTNLAKINNYYIGYRDSQGSWGLNFGEVINMINVTNTLPNNVEIIPTDTSGFDKEYFMTFIEYEAARLGDGCRDDYDYYCTVLEENKWVRQKGLGTIQFMLEDSKVYRRLGSITSSLTLARVISKDLKIIVRFHDETTESEKNLTAFNVSAIGGADEAQTLIGNDDIKKYLRELFIDLGLSTSPIDNLILHKTYF